MSEWQTSFNERYLLMFELFPEYAVFIAVAVLTNQNLRVLLLYKKNHKLRSCPDHRSTHRISFQHFKRSLAKIQSISNKKVDSYIANSRCR